MKSEEISIQPFEGNDLKEDGSEVGSKGVPNDNVSLSVEKEKMHEYTPDCKNKNRIAKGRIFQCTGYPDCHMSFTRSEHLARHKRKHTGERPFTCSLCSKCFSRLDNLRQHQQTVHACDKLSSSSTAKDKHQKKCSKSKFPPGITFFDETRRRPKLDVPMISPPNSSSPVNSYHFNRLGSGPPNTYQTQNNNDIPGFSRQPLKLPTIAPSVNSVPNPPVTDILRIPLNGFKPKRRPKPLLLQHSFMNNSIKSDQTIDYLPLSYSNHGYLQSAPPLLSGCSNFSMVCNLDTPRTALYTPATTSPYSPLFHRTFPQGRPLTFGGNKFANRDAFPPSPLLTGNSVPVDGHSTAPVGPPKKSPAALSFVLNEEEGDSEAILLKDSEVKDSTN